MWCDDDTIKPYFTEAGRNITYGNLKRQLQSPCFCGFAEKIKNLKKSWKKCLTFTRLSYYNNQVSSRENKNKQHSASGCNDCSSRTWIWDLSSAGRASALQAEGHRFEPYRSHTWKEYGEIAQLARAHGSYPWCREFESPSRYYMDTLNKGVFFAYTGKIP